MIIYQITIEEKEDGRLKVHRSAPPGMATAKEIAFAKVLIELIKATAAVTAGGKVIEFSEN